MSQDPAYPENDPNLSALGRAMLGGDSAASRPSSKPSAVWEPPTAYELHKLLPQYEIMKMLGRGGMGAVYMGRQISLDRPVAIKILSATLGDADVGFSERFKNEARAMAKLNHPGIVSVYDFGETEGGLLYIVMEYVDGTDVARMIAANGRLHTEHAMAITAHVCDALAYAHERGIIHRDIKPANIMVGYDGSVKVADFGLAKVSNSGPTSGLTQSGVAMGTLHYMAPEALVLGAAVDHRADIYAVGVMLYQMLTGKIPQGMFELPSLQIKGLDPRYDKIIAKALREDREVRYQDIREVRSDLDDILTQPVARVVENAPQAPASLATEIRPKRPGDESCRANYRPPSPTTIIVRKGGSSLGWWVAFSALVLAVGYIWIQQKTTSEGLGRNAQESPSPPSSKSIGVVGTPQNPPPMQPRLTEPPVSEAPKTSVQDAKASRPSASSLPNTTAATAELAANTVWIDTKGRTIKAKFVRMDGGKVLLDIAGSITPVAMNTLSAESQQLATSLAKSLASTERDPELAKAAAAAVPFALDTIDESTKDHIRRGVSIVKVLSPNIKRHLRLTAEQEDFVKTRDVKLQTDCGLVRIREAANGGGSAEVIQLIGEAMRDVLETFTMEQILTWEAMIGPGAENLRPYSGFPYLSAIKQKRLSGIGPTRSHESSNQSQLSNIQLPLKTPPSVSTKSTTGNRPLTNSLGMKFVSVPGTKVLMCIHETRRQDYAIYADAEPKADRSWQEVRRDGNPSGHQDDHPVVGVSWMDASAFCSWLSKKEGRTYRLPKDEEWSLAVGLGRFERRDSTATPETLSLKENPHFPWIGNFPPSPNTRSGNYGDVTWRSLFPTKDFLQDYTDGAATTAPVMSHAANDLGIYDLGGNVWEWVEDWYDSSQKERTIRGASFSNSDQKSLRSSYRNHPAPWIRLTDIGFRLVIELP